MPTLSPKVTPYYGGGQVVNPANVLKTKTTPGTNLTDDKLGTIQINNATATAWMLVSKSGGVDTWLPLGTGSAGDIMTLTGDTGGALSPTAGNINIKGTTNQITITGSGSTLTLTIPSSFVAPGTVSGTSVTASAGNLVASGVGSGLLLTPTVVAAAASPQTANGRVGSVTFSSVSIAAGATQAFTISNSSITGSGTLLLLSMVGATSGAALTIQSVVNSASQSVITVTNGTGATTTTANITFTYEVLN